MPEDIIIEHGKNENNIYFIAEGKVQVSVFNNMRNKVQANELDVGSYFGELSMLFGNNRSAEVVSISYCTLASLSAQNFQQVWKSSPKIVSSFRENCLAYSDEWIEFKVVLLKQVDYFQDLGWMDDEENFYKNIQFYMKEVNFQAGQEIASIGKTCQNLIFIVNGLVELEVYDPVGEAISLAKLGQGSLIGQYSVLFKEDLGFSIICRTAVRVLIIPESFFHDLVSSSKQHNRIKGLDDALDRAQSHVDLYGIPVCDFKVYDNGLSPITLRERFNNAVNRILTLNKMHFKKKDLFGAKGMQLLKQLIEEEERLEEELKQRQLKHLLQHQETYVAPIGWRTKNLITENTRIRRGSAMKLIELKKLGGQLPEELDVGPINTAVMNKFDSSTSIMTVIEDKNGSSIDQKVSSLTLEQFGKKSEAKTDNSAIKKVEEIKDDAFNFIIEEDEQENQTESVSSMEGRSEPNAQDLPKIKLLINKIMQQGQLNSLQ